MCVSLSICFESLCAHTVQSACIQLVCVCKLLCCAAVNHRTFYGYDEIRDMLKLRGASDGVRTCILRMLAEDPDDRYSMNQALHDPWLLQASKPNHLKTSRHFHPPTNSPQPSPSHAPPAALAATNACRRAMKKPAVKAVLSPRKTRAGTKIDTRAPIKRAAKVQPVPLVHPAVKPIKEKAQLPIHTNRHSASLVKGVSSIYGIGLNQVVKLHEYPTMILWSSFVTAYLCSSGASLLDYVTAHTWCCECV